GPAEEPDDRLHGPRRGECRSDIRRATARCRGVAARRVRACLRHGHQARRGRTAGPAGPPLLFVSETPRSTRGQESAASALLAEALCGAGGTDELWAEDV